MDIQTRKLEFIQEFLSIQNEEIVSMFEHLLITIRKEDNIKNLTIEELNNRIDMSENDFEFNRFKNTNELLDKYKCK